MKMRLYYLHIGKYRLTKCFRYLLRVQQLFHIDFFRFIDIEQLLLLINNKEEFIVLDKTKLLEEMLA